MIFQWKSTDFCAKIYSHLTFVLKTSPMHSFLNMDIGPHFLHWKVNLGSWITWYISETEYYLVLSGLWEDFFRISSVSYPKILHWRKLFFWFSCLTPLWNNFLSCFDPYIHVATICFGCYGTFALVAFMRTYFDIF